MAATEGASKYTTTSVNTTCVCVVHVCVVHVCAVLETEWKRREEWQGVEGGVARDCGDTSDGE